jgi:arylsulfatase A-like enzyme
MYNDMKFNLPKTAYTGLRKEPGMPNWNYHDHKNANLDNADTLLEEYEKSYFYQQYMQRYFAMIKCIDDNVGKMLHYLKRTGLDENTIIV